MRFSLPEIKFCLVKLFATMNIKSEKSDEKRGETAIVGPTSHVAASKADNISDLYGTETNFQSGILQL